jgi:hypothetical protein
MENMSRTDPELGEGLHPSDVGEDGDGDVRTDDEAREQVAEDDGLSQLAKDDGRERGDAEDKGKIDHEGAIPVHAAMVTRFEDCECWRKRCARGGPRAHRSISSR